MIDIMPAIMRRLLPLLLLGLSACEAVQPLLSQVAGAAAGAVQGAAQQALGIQDTTPTPNPVGTPPQTPPPSAASGATAGTSAPTSANKTVTFDSTRKLEYVDIYVDMGDPAGQRALVPYLMKPEDWMLCRCEMLSPTTKHYTFMRVSTADGRSLPQVDIFKQSR
jgi:hypothetical protein